MSIMSKSTALTVYKSGFCPTSHDLIHSAFINIDDTADPMSRGFVNIDDYLDNSWAKSPAQKGRFTAFSFRVDTRRIPGAVLKKKCAIRMEEEKTSTGRKFLSKERKTEIMYQERLRLLTKTEPAPAVFDVVADPVENKVYLCSSSKSVKEAFENHWTHFFEDFLVEQTPGVLSNSNNLLTDASDFLTEVFEHGYDLSGANLSIPNKATIASHSDKASVALEAPDSMELSTLSAPLTEGKVVKATVHLMGAMGDEYVMAIRASDLGINGLKTPTVEKAKGDDDPDAAFLEKMFLVEKAVATLYEAYRTYAGVITTSEDF